MKELSKAIFWTVVSLLMILFFMVTGTSFIQTFYFVSFLMPVVIFATHYISNHLIPTYLLSGKPWQFALYGVYALVFALYAQAIILFISLILFSGFQEESINKLTIDLLALGLGTFLIIIIHALYQAIVQLTHQKKVIAELQREDRLKQMNTITVRANRKNQQVQLDQLLLIESKGDYLHLYTDTETIVTKERISHLSSELPPQFIRVHRSFIINKNKVPISRTYKKAALDQLQPI